jgi:hypothetical protein
LSPQGKHSRVRTPSRLTLTVACSTVLAAGAVAAGVALWPGAATAQSGRHPAAAGQTGLGQSLADFEAAHARAQASASAAASAAATRRAAARARQEAARRAARLAAQRRAAASASPTPSPATSQAPVTAAPAQPSGSPQQIAQSLLASYGWSSSQFSCLEPLWEEESGWDVTADNPGSGAYGIPQALPGAKMASAGPDWETDATTQIKWGLSYIQGTYGSPCAAWAHEEADGWY